MQCPVDSQAECTSWFVNSYQEILLLAEQQQISDPDLVDRLYEQTFNVKLIINSSEWVDKVEFPSWEDATLFIIKWS
jgi:hypothetical protein